MEEPKIAAFISDHFEIIRTLKESPDKRVLKVRNRTSGSPYLVRIFSGDPSVYNRLLTVRSPYLPEVYEVIADETETDAVRQTCTVTVLEEFIEGDRMAEMMQGCLFSEKETRKIGTDLCQALYVLHGLGIVHRDIKPENIILLPARGALL